MKVDKKDDRQEQPDECDNCGTARGNLRRYESYGPGFQVAWLCPYCEVILPGNLTKTLANMFNVLEARSKASMAKVPGE